jgi:hypothetical protein
MARNKRNRSEPLTAQEWALYRCLDGLILNKEDRKMTVAEWRYKTMKRFKERSGGW